MSVAEPTTSEPVPRSPEAQLAGASLVGALFLLGSFLFIFSILPTVWHQMFAGTATTKEILNPFLSGALLLIVCIGAIVGVGFLGNWLDKNYSQKGVHAGSFFGAVSLFFVAWITISVGNWLDLNDDLDLTVRVGITLVVLAALLFGLARLFLASGFRSFLLAIEEQGWFNATTFKPNQGHKVRRATIAGILTIGACGIYTMVMHRALGTGLVTDNDWFWWIPFVHTEMENGSTGYYAFYILYKVHFMVPFLMGLALIWIAWRIVNWPTFADFLIATEAEINKVSWTTRKRLVTDTIVVLTTVAFLTIFLFVVDILWIQILSNRFFPILYVDIRGEQAKQLEKTLW